jgi:hypothetical protein
VELNGTIIADGHSGTVRLQAGATLALALAVASGKSFEGTVVVEQSHNQIAWEQAQLGDGTPLAYTGPVGTGLTDVLVQASLVNESQKPRSYRVRAFDITADPVLFSLNTASAAGDVVAPVVEAADFEAVTLGAIDQVCDLGVFETRVTTSGAGAGANLAIGDGTGVRVGTRHLVTLAVLAHASDAVVLDEANIIGEDTFPLGTPGTFSAVTIDGAGGFLLLEWSGVGWVVIYAGDATLTATA